jgi:hypothetical protein
MMRYAVLGNDPEAVVSDSKRKSIDDESVDCHQTNG